MRRIGKCAACFRYGVSNSADITLPVQPGTVAQPQRSLTSSISIRPLPSGLVGITHGCLSTRNRTLYDEVAPGLTARCDAIVQREVPRCGSDHGPQEDPQRLTSYADRLTTRPGFQCVNDGPCLAVALAPYSGEGVPSCRERSYAARAATGVTRRKRV
jgi:hypothetical protein